MLPYYPQEKHKNSTLPFAFTKLADDTTSIRAFHVEVKTSMAIILLSARKFLFNMYRDIRIKLRRRHDLEDNSTGFPGWAIVVISTIDVMMIVV